MVVVQEENEVRFSYTGKVIREYKVAGPGIIFYQVDSDGVDNVVVITVKEMKAAYEFCLTKISGV